MFALFTRSWADKTALFHTTQNKTVKILIRYFFYMKTNILYISHGAFVAKEKLNSTGSYLATQGSQTDVGRNLEYEERSQYQCSVKSYPHPM